MESDDNLNRSVEEKKKKILKWDDHDGALLRKCTLFGKIVKDKNLKGMVH